MITITLPKFIVWLIALVMVLTAVAWIMRIATLLTSFLRIETLESQYGDHTH